MPGWVIEILNGMLGGGIFALLAAFIGFMFREKWKQMLQRSLTRDMEQIKHDFQQKLEAYKVTLIAEAEAAKARQDLRKSVALRYAEIEFERIVALEQVTSPLYIDILSYANIAVDNKSIEQQSLALDKIKELSRAVELAGIFLTVNDKFKFLELKKRLIEVIDEHVGLGKLLLSSNEILESNFLHAVIAVHGILSERIKELGNL
ncbi:MAG TPA: hypothetical protein VFS89_02170 [Nitrosospira sp.]|nr:hypothetical protein [Nitrosospira sp.]